MTYQFWKSLWMMNLDVMEIVLSVRHTDFYFEHI